MSVRVFDLAAGTCLRQASLDEAVEQPGSAVVWIDLASPSRDELVTLQHAYGFHQLAIEDALKRRQRPKVDVYEDHIFIVLYALNPPRDGVTPLANELAIFASAKVVVTIRTAEIDELTTAASRWAEHCSNTDQQTATMLVYTLLDTVVDGFFPVMDDLAEEIELLETEMFEHHGQETLQRIFELKRGLLELRRVVAPTRDVFNLLTRRELPLLGQESLYYFQDVYDHVIRITDQIDADRDILSSAVDIHLSLLSNEMNQTVRTLTAASIILMSLALIAGIYGMNFQHMPELTWRYGYFSVLGMMLLLAGALLWLFRRLDWW